MTEGNHPNDEVDQFIVEQVDTIPHLEALLLVWNRRPKPWSAIEMAAALYVSKDLAGKVLFDLAQRGLLQEEKSSPLKYIYTSSSDKQDALIARVNDTYRRELIRITHMIHSKASSAVREFARSFRFTKDGE
jgi:DNA-binding MarR family transcriptional regulator